MPAGTRGVIGGLSPSLIALLLASAESPHKGFSDVPRMKVSQIRTPKLNTSAGVPYPSPSNTWVVDRIGERGMGWYRGFLARDNLGCIRFKIQFFFSYTFRVFATSYIRWNKTRSMSLLLCTIEIHPAELNQIWLFTNVLVVLDTVMRQSTSSCMEALIHKGVTNFIIVK